MSDPTITTSVAKCACCSSSSSTSNSSSSASSMSSSSSESSESSESSASSGSSDSNSSESSTSMSSTSNSSASSYNSASSTTLNNTCYQAFQSNWQCDHWGNPIRTGGPECGDPLTITFNQWEAASGGEDPCTMIINVTDATDTVCTDNVPCQGLTYTPPTPPEGQPSGSCNCSSSSSGSSAESSASSEESLSSDTGSSNSESSSTGFTIGKCATEFVCFYECATHSWGFVNFQDRLCVDPTTTFDQWFTTPNNPCTARMYRTDGITCRANLGIPNNPDCQDSDPPAPSAPTFEPSSCCSSTSSSSI